MSEQIMESTNMPGGSARTDVENPLHRKTETQNDTSTSGNGVASIGMLMDVILQLTVELGRTQLTVRQVLDLQKGSVIELNRIAGDSVDVYVNEHMLARGEVVVVDDKFGVRITELVAPIRENGEPLS